MTAPHDLAPIALFAYNRPHYLEQTLSSLRRNTLAGQSDLIVFCDGPKPTASRNDEVNIQRVRELAHSCDGFKSVHVRLNEENRGLANSIISGVTDTITKFGRVIVMEDDMLTSPFFLSFMNTGLVKYERSERVISLNGYSFPADFPESVPETFFINSADCWGWATWKRGWDLFNPNAGQLIEEIVAKKLERQFNFDNAFDYMKMLRLAEKTNHSWAVRWYASAFVNQKLSVYPKNSLVANIGAVGTNVSETSMAQFGSELSDVNIDYYEQEEKENRVARECIQRHLRRLNKKGILSTVLSKWRSLKSS